MVKKINRVKSTNDLELKDRLVAINRVTKVTKGGRTFSFAAIVVVGNEDGVIGWGLGKAGEVTTAIAKGVEAAKKNLIKVPVHKGTIPHEQYAKFGGARVLIKPATQGTGVKAGGPMRAVLESAGITDVLAKSKGSSNPHNLSSLSDEDATYRPDGQSNTGRQPLLEDESSLQLQYLSLWTSTHPSASRCQRLWYSTPACGRTGPSSTGSSARRTYALACRCMILRAEASWYVPSAP